MAHADVDTVGFAMLFLGIGMFIPGIIGLIVPSLVGSLGGTCLALSLAAVGLLLALVGIVLLSITSIIDRPPPSWRSDARVPRGSPLLTAAPDATHCPVCGTSLHWVPEAARSYCHTCEAYR